MTTGGTPNASNEVEGYKASTKAFDEIPTTVQLLDAIINEHDWLITIFRSPACIRAGSADEKRAVSVMHAMLP
jgi:hypothetical protein